MAHRIEQVTGVPMVSVTYDGIGGSKNDVIVPYLKYPRARPAPENSHDFKQNKALVHFGNVVQ
jgi:hypothetical protein